MYENLKTTLLLVTYGMYLLINYQSCVARRNDQNNDFETFYEVPNDRKAIQELQCTIE